jgi:hypothetical protein
VLEFGGDAHDVLRVQAVVPDPWVFEVPIRVIVEPLLDSLANVGGSVLAGRFATVDHCRLRNSADKSRVSAYRGQLVDRAHVKIMTCFTRSPLEARSVRVDQSVLRSIGESVGPQ